MELKMGGVRITVPAKISFHSFRWAPGLRREDRSKGTRKEPWIELGGSDPCSGGKRQKEMNKR